MTLSEEYTLFYFHVGLTLTQWSHVEHALSLAVSSSFDGANRKAVRIGFNSIENFRSKLRYCDSIALERWRDTAHAEPWARLHDRVVSASKRRNILAHGGVQIFVEGTPGRRVVLMKHGATPDSPKPPSGALGMRDLVAARYEFSSLHNGLFNLHAVVNGDEVVLPEATLPLPTLAQLRAEGVAMLRGFGSQAEEAPQE